MMHSTSTFGLSHFVYSGGAEIAPICSSKSLTLNIPSISEGTTPTKIKLAHEELFPHLGWMTSLKSFIFIKRGKIHPFRDRFVSELTNWMFTQERATDSLQRLWIQEESIEPYLSSPSITSLNLKHYRRHNLNQKKYRNLQHVSGIHFSRLANLPNLKYARGYCTNKKGLSRFCRNHPMLEHLHLDSCYEEELRGDCTLLHLKTLVYRCYCPSKEFVAQLMDFFLNIESLHIGYHGNADEDQGRVDFLSAIRFSRLTSLSFSGFDLNDGEFMPSILEQCPKLETLLISNCTFGPGSFLRVLGHCIQTAINLRDLRLVWDHKEDESDVRNFMKDLLKCSLHLERLVLSGGTFIYSRSNDRIPSARRPAFLFDFISQMGHLRALCLATFWLKQIYIEEIKRRVVEEILPVRPSFWLHLDNYLPQENDQSAAPRLHYDQIANPMPFFDVPPTF